MPLNRLLSRGVLGLVAVLLAAPAVAGQFSVTPVRIFMAPQDRAASEEGPPAGSPTRSAIRRRPPVSRASSEDAPVATVIRHLERCRPIAG